MKVMELDKRVIVVETEGGITSPDEAIIETGMMDLIGVCFEAMKGME